MTGTSKPRFVIRRIVRAVGCKEDHQCSTGFYCEVSQLACRQCINCADLNRLPLQANVTSCVTSVTACGACLAGLVPSPSDNKCLSPDDQQLLLPYEWAVIAVSLLLAVIICAVAVYVLRHFDTFKLYTRTSVLTPVDVEASAPQLPPAYNDVAAVPPANLLRQEDERVPFIKPISPPRKNVAPESARRQVANVFTTPEYVRNAQLPGFEQVFDGDDDQQNIQETLPTIQETASDINSNEDSINSANAIPPEVEESNAIGSQVARTSPAKLVQTTQEGNTISGNDGDGEGEDARDRSRTLAGGCTGTAFVINVFSNNNTAQQGNQLNL